MSNILKIALQKNEETVACIITAYYEIELEEDMVVRAITSNNYHWLLFVWAFDKNYIGLRNQKEAIQLTFEQLFELMKKQYTDPIELEKKIKDVIEWKIIT